MGWSIPSVLGQELGLGRGLSTERRAAVLVRLQNSRNTVNSVIPVIFLMALQRGSRPPGSASFSPPVVREGEHHAVAVTPVGKALHDKVLPNSEPKLRALFTGAASKVSTSRDAPPVLMARPVRAREPARRACLPLARLAACEVGDGHAASVRRSAPNRPAPHPPWARLPGARAPSAAVSDGRSRCRGRVRLRTAGTVSGPLCPRSSCRSRRTRGRQSSLP
jgi:hypothetical protein